MTRQKYAVYVLEDKLFAAIQGASNDRYRPKLRIRRRIIGNSFYISG